MICLFRASAMIFAARGVEMARHFLARVFDFLSLPRRRGARSATPLIPLNDAKKASSLIFRPAVIPRRQQGNEKSHLHGRCAV